MRWVRPVHTDDPVSTRIATCGNFRDRNARRVRRQDRVGWCQLEDLIEHFMLQFQFLWHCFDHQINILHRICKVATKADTSTSNLWCRQTIKNSTCNIEHDGCFVESCLTHVVKTGLTTCTLQHCTHSWTHCAGTNNCNFLECTHRSTLSLFC